MSTPNPYAPPQAEVSDAPLSSTTELAGRLARFAAQLIDILLAVASCTPVYVAAFSLFGGQPSAIGGPVAIDPARGASMGFAALTTGIALLILTVIQLILLAHSGQSIGKRALSIRIVKTNGERASLVRIVLLRVIVANLPALIPSGYGRVFALPYWIIDSLFIFSGSRRCLHDLIAGTLVVKARSA